VLVLERERLQRTEAEATVKKEREDTFDRQRRTDEEISNLTAALREAVSAQRVAEAKMRLYKLNSVEPIACESAWFQPCAPEM
jgi:hypothetical protein